MGATKTLMALMVKTRAMVQSIQVATTDLEVNSFDYLLYSN